MEVHGLRSFRRLAVGCQHPLVLYARFAQCKARTFPFKAIGAHVALHEVLLGAAVPAIGSCFERHDEQDGWTLASGG